MALHELQGTAWYNRWIMSHRIANRGRRRAVVEGMGLFHHHHHRDAYDDVYGGRRPHHEMTHELLAAAVGFEAMHAFERHREREGIPVRHQLPKELLAAFVAAEIDKHFEDDRYRHLDRHKARRHAYEQAEYLWNQRYGR